MTRLRRLDAVGFRGIRLAAPLDFTERCASMVVYGANGHGKSSYVDALECYFTHRIGHLERENVSRAAYRHRRTPRNELASVRAEFSEPEKTGHLTVDGDRHVQFAPEGPDAEGFSEAAGQELIILRHRDLSRFVDMTKREKLADLAPLLGVEVLDQTRGEFQTALRQLEADLTTQGRLIAERQTTVAQQLGMETYHAEGVWRRIGENLLTLGVGERVQDVESLQKTLAGVQISVDPTRDQRVRSLQDAQSAMESPGRLPDVVRSIRNFVTSFNHLASDERALQDLALTGLWQAGLEVLRSEWWGERICPLCRQPIDDREQLSRELDAGLDTAARIRERRAEVETLRDRARQAVRISKETIASALQAAQNYQEARSFVELATEADGVLAKLSQLLETPLGPGRSIDEAPLQEWENSIPKTRSSAEESLKQLGTLLEGLSVGGEEGTRLQAYRVLSSVHPELARLDTLAEEREAIERQTQSMRRVLRDFEAHERRSMTRILEQISGDVSRYYQKLHGGERYANVRLAFLADGRGLEFSLEAFGENISPPRLVLSESHLNSLGLCLFLAAAREFNTATRFLVLDDIVNSFDANHRGQLANLLIEEFADYQIIAFTHDPIWFDILRRMAPRWEVRRIVGWSYELGVQMELRVVEERERIERYLDEGEEGIAGNLVRQYTERRLKDLCRDLRVPLPYREGYANEQRSPEELFRALDSHVQGHRQFVGRDHSVWGEFRASPFLANLASHDQPAMPVPLSVGDIRFALEKLDELVSLFRCTRCRKWVWSLRRDQSSDESQCECGGLRFR